MSPTVNNRTDGANRRGLLLFHGKRFWQDFEQNGPVHAHMVWTWQWVFSPAVALGLAGFLALLISTGSQLLLFGAAAILTTGLLYYHVVRPRLGTD